MEKIQPNKQERTKKIICIVLVAAAVLIIGGLVGYAVGQAQKNEAIENAKQEAEQQAREKHAESQERPTHEQAPPKTTTDLTCNADELSLALQPSGEGESAGSRHYNVVLENTGTRICTLGGYPGVSLVNENGNQIGDPAERVADAEEPLVTLNPGDRTQAALTVANSDNFPDGECKDGATKLRVYPPNDTGYLSVGTDITSWCPGFMIAPVVAAENA